MGVLSEIMEKFGLSIYKVSKLTGYDKSTISLVKRGLYPKQAEMEAKLVEILKRHGYSLNEEKEAKKEEVVTKKERSVYRVDRNVFLQTGNVKKLFSIAEELLDENADLTSSFVIVAGTAGRGKTTAGIRFCVQNPRAVYVLYIDGMTLTQLAREISYEFTKVRPHSFQECLENIDRATRRHRRLLIVDEADKMPKKYIEALRGINERFNI